MISPPDTVDEDRPLVAVLRAQLLGAVALVGDGLREGELVAGRRPGADRSRHAVVAPERAVGVEPERPS
jgi:hypothetical protein